MKRHNFHLRFNNLLMDDRHRLHDPRDEEVSLVYLFFSTT